MADEYEPVDLFRQSYDIAFRQLDTGGPELHNFLEDLKKRQLEEHKQLDLRQEEERQDLGSPSEQMNDRHWTEDADLRKRHDIERRDFVAQYHDAKKIEAELNQQHEEQLKRDMDGPKISR